MLEVQSNSSIVTADQQISEKIVSIIDKRQPFLQYFELKRSNLLPVDIY